MIRRPEIHVGDIATELRVQVLDQDRVAVDLSAATCALLVAKPDGTVVEWVATAGSLEAGLTAVLGWMYYLTVEADLDQAGKYRLQGRVTIGIGQWRTDIHDILVHDSLIVVPVP